MAPCYRYYPLTFRLKNNQTTTILYTESDIRSWLPGDNLCDATIAVPADLPAGEYELSLGLLDELSENPKIQLAIAGRDPTGWYPRGRIEVRR